MNSLIYVDAFLSHPRSGLALYLALKPMEELARYMKWPKPEATRAALLGLRKEKDGDRDAFAVAFSFQPFSPESRAFARQSKDEKLRCTFQPLHKALNRPDNGELLSFFGLIPVRLNLDPAKGEGWVVLPESLPPYYERHVVRRPAAHAEAPPAAASTPPATDPAGGLVSVQLRLPGQPELSFSLPLSEAFGVALDWTRRGYAR